MEGTKPESESPVSTGERPQIYFTIVRFKSSPMVDVVLMIRQKLISFFISRTLFVAPEGNWFPGVAGIVSNVQRNG